MSATVFANRTALLALDRYTVLHKPAGKLREHSRPCKMRQGSLQLCCQHPQLSWDKSSAEVAAEACRHLIPSSWQLMCSMPRLQSTPSALATATA